NLNRSFPGDPTGTPTQMIAHYIEHALLSRAQYLVDLHSGGSSLLYQGGNMLAIDPLDAEEAEKLNGLLVAFGLQNALLHAPNPVHSASAARRQGAISIVTELGGGGMADPSLIRLGRHGLLHYLGYIGLLRGALVPDAPPTVTRFMRVDGERHFVYAYERGLYEPLVELGDQVKAGQPAAWVHFPDTPLREPVLHRFKGDGEVVCKRVPAQVQRGDCMFQLAELSTPARVIE
ncbi:MAG: succinylglutamate desuccinylase/aspartoacylase family protein, partial [Burkholderia sp.]|nr:succinylglutamate desuccinylase/aspartoacylase family protein [Burkholderia sp.]